MPAKTGHTVACEQCGIKVARPPAHAARAKHTFCSHTCHGKWMLTHEHHARRPDNERECQHCGKRYRVWGKRRRADSVACSTACRVKLIPKAKPRPTRRCPVCKKRFRLRPMGKKKYVQCCSRACANVRHGRRMTGKGNPRFVHGQTIEEYSSAFRRKIRLAVRTREGRKCFLCGTPEAGKGLDIHHVDFDKRNDTLENLVGLCNRCHSRCDGRPARRARIAMMLLRKLSQRYGYPARSLTSELLATITTSRKAS